VTPDALPIALLVVTDTLLEDTLVFFIAGVDSSIIGSSASSSSSSMPVGHATWHAVTVQIIW
jgi:hypothetical protein